MIRGIHNFIDTSQFSQAPNKQTAKKGSFAQTLKDVISEVNHMQFESKQMNEAFVRGDVEDLHQVTLTASKARIGFELLLEIRNKLLEGYKEIMRMPV